jgi:hypothetical protein
VTSILYQHASSFDSSFVESPVFQMGDSSLCHCFLCFHGAKHCICHASLFTITLLLISSAYSGIVRSSWWKGQGRKEAKQVQSTYEDLRRLRSSVHLEEKVGTFMGRNHMLLQELQRKETIWPAWRRSRINNCIAIISNKHVKQACDTTYMTIINHYTAAVSSVSAFSFSS